MIDNKMSLVRILIGLVGVAVVGILATPAASSAATCDALPGDKGRSSYTITVTAPGTYTFWARMAKQAPDHDSVVVQIDNQCPITVGDAMSSDGLQWIQYRDGNTAAPITVDLTNGAHTVTLDGRETGVVVDKVMFVGNPSCVPVASGDNCLADTIQTPSGNPESKAVTASAKPTGAHKLWIALSIGAALGAAAFMVFKFIAFERRVRQAPLQVGQVVIGGAFYTDLHVFRRLFYFARHHWLIVTGGGLIIILSIAVGLAAAVQPYPVFEAESGALSGGAKIADNAAASGGKVLVFETNPPGTSTAPTSNGSTSTQTSGNTSTQGSTSSGSSGSGSSSGGSSTGGGSSGGGSGACGTTTAHIPDGPDGMGGCWPGASNTGVPNGVALTNYTGPCTITTPNTVIDAKNITCQILVRADNLTIKRSYLTGGVSGLEADGASFRIEDSWLDNGVCVNCSVDGWNFTILRTEITGSNRGAYCMRNCLVQDSWIHATGLDPNSEWHASAVRAEQYATLRHNVLHCDWTGPYNNDELGCSADMSGYPDFVPIHHNTIDRNLFGANPEGLGYCAYGGGTGGKTYSNDPLNATYVVFTDNVFQRGANNKCGTWGAITDFIAGRTGNQWTNNKWSDGAIVNLD
jgi:uncharacterized membrane protein YgcG